MANTTRKPGYNQNYFSGTTSILSEFDKLRNRRTQYSLFDIDGNYVGSRWSIHAYKTDEELLAEATESYNRQTRDGRNGYTCTTVNSGFKKDAAKATRRANKHFCKMVLDEDPRWEDTPYPNGHEGDTYIWDWW